MYLPATVVSTAPSTGPSGSTKKPLELYTLSAPHFYTLLHTFGSKAGQY